MLLIHLNLLWLLLSTVDCPHHLRLASQSWECLARSKYFCRFSCSRGHIWAKTFGDGPSSTPSSIWKTLPMTDVQGLGYRGHLYTDPHASNNSKLNVLQLCS